MIALAIMFDTFQSSSAASAAVAQIFKQACVLGEFRLSPERGRVVKEQKLGYLDSGGARPAKETTIQFTDPPKTHLTFGDYKNVQPKSIARECVVVSRSITRMDAMAAFMGTAPDIEPVQTWVPNMYSPEWTIDAPSRGFRARMRILGDKSILLEVGTYTAAVRNLPSPGIVHQ